MRPVEAQETITVIEVHNNTRLIMDNNIMMIKLGTVTAPEILFPADCHLEANGLRLLNKAEVRQCLNRVADI